MLCGNVVYRSALQRLIGNERAAMVFTDPAGADPTAKGDRTGLPNFARSEWAASSAACCGPLAISLRNLAEACRGGALLYVGMGWEQMPEVFGPGRYAGLALEGVCVWVKEGSRAGSLYRRQHQPVLVFRTEEDGGESKVRLARPGRNRTDVWRYPAVKPQRRKRGKQEQPKPRPDIKPVTLVADAILDVTARGEIVLDGFLGNGTTLIAAERTQRRCFGIEADPAAVDDVIRRWQNLTGERLPDTPKPAQVSMISLMEWWWPMPLDDPGHEVGYKKPPVHSRWPKGTSGNRSGRKRGSKNWKTLFLEAMAAKITINEEGRRRRVSKEDSMFIQLANQAAQGNARARNDVQRLREYIERTTPPEKPKAESKAGFRIPVVILPYNERDPLHPDLKALYLKAFEEFCDTHPEARDCSAPLPEEKRREPPADSP